MAATVVHKKCSEAAAVPTRPLTSLTAARCSSGTRLCRMMGTNHSEAHAVLLKTRRIVVARSWFGNRKLLVS